MSNASVLVHFYLRTAPVQLWFYLLPVLIFIIPWINWIGDGVSSGLEIALMTSPGNLFSLLAGFAFLAGASGQKGWALPNRVPYSEFLVTRPVGRLRLCAAGLAVFHLIVLGPAVLALGITTIQSDMHFLLYKSETQSTEAADHQAMYEKGFPGSYIKKGKSSSTLVAPHALLYVKAWQLSLLVMAATVLQLLLFRRRVESRSGRFLFYGVLALFLLPLFLTLWRKGFISQFMEPMFFAFVRYWPFWSLVMLAIFVAAQFWTLRFAREMEVL